VPGVLSTDMIDVSLASVACVVRCVLYCLHRFAFALVRVLLCGDNTAGAFLCLERFCKAFIRDGVPGPADEPKLPFLSWSNIDSAHAPR